jgi:hypothetical protein
MTGLTQTEQQATLDQRFPTSAGGDYIAYSINGTSEFSGLTRTAIGATGWAAATAATPSVKANANQLTTAAATVAATSPGITHAAIYSASTAGTQRTDWQALATARPVTIGDTLTWAVGAFQITLD